MIFFDKKNNLLDFSEAGCSKNKELNRANGLDLNKCQKENLKIKIKNNQKAIEEKIKKNL